MYGTTMWEVLSVSVALPIPGGDAEREPRPPAVDVAVAPSFASHLKWRFPGAESPVPRRSGRRSCAVVPGGGRPGPWESPKATGSYGGAQCRFGHAGDCHAGGGILGMPAGQGTVQRAGEVAPERRDLKPFRYG